MIQEIQAQFWRKQTLYEGRLTTSLGSDQRGHTLVAVKCVHLKPVGHSRAQPDGEVVHLLRTEAWQTTEELGYMILSIPLRQAVDKLTNGVVDIDLLRMDILHNVRLWTALLAHTLALGTDDNTV